MHTIDARCFSGSEIALTNTKVIAKGDAREVGHTLLDSSQYLACIMFINLFSASIKL